MIFKSVRAIAFMFASAFCAAKYRESPIGITMGLWCTGMYFTFGLFFSYLKEIIGSGGAKEEAKTA